MKSKINLCNIKTFICLMVMGLLFISLPVKADSVNEVEPNNDKETAQTIQANNETIQGTINHTYAGQHIIRGYSSSNDDDWFKVYLYAGDNYLTCNEDSFGYRIVNEDESFVESGTYTEVTFGARAYWIDIPSDDYYYVRIRGLTSTSNSYLFLIGSPTYYTAQCNISCLPSTINMPSSGSNVTGIFAGTSVTNLPDDAIAASVKMTGVSSTAINGITLTNVDAGTSFNLGTYNLSYNNLGSMNLFVSSNWNALFKYKKVTSFTPVLKIYYVYPLYDVAVQ